MKEPGSADPAGSVAAMQQVIERWIYRISADGVYLVRNNARTHGTRQKNPTNPRIAWDSLLTN